MYIFRKVHHTGRGDDGREWEEVVLVSVTCCGRSTSAGVRIFEEHFLFLVPAKWSSGPSNAFYDPPPVFLFWKTGQFCTKPEIGLNLPGNLLQKKYKI